MAKDYKRAAYKPKAQIPGWALFASGLAVGLFVAGLVYLQMSEERQKAAQQIARTDVAPAAPATPAKDTTAQPPKFDFYTILPEQEVIIPDQESKASKSKADKAKSKNEKAATTPPTTGAKTGTYMLQVGSFRRFEDADRRKAQLALIGIESSVQTVTDSLFRVRVGPFDNIESANQMRARLAQGKFETLLLQLKT